MSDAGQPRRRWLTLAEVVAIAGLVVASLTLLNNWSARRSAEAEKQVINASQTRERGRVDLVATVENGGESLRLTDERHRLQDLVVRFPSSLGIAIQRPAADVALDADWIAEPLLKLTDGGPDERTGRLPVLISVSYWDGDVARTATGVYDIIWRTEGRVLRGRAFHLEALHLRKRGGDQGQINALWTKERAALNR